MKIPDMFWPGRRKYEIAGLFLFSSKCGNHVTGI
jgi:hypothetical protein